MYNEIDASSSKRIQRVYALGALAVMASGFAFGKVTMANNNVSNLKGTQFLATPQQPEYVSTQDADLDREKLSELNAELDREGVSDKDKQFIIGTMLAIEAAPEIAATVEGGIAAVEAAEAGAAGAEAAGAAETGGGLLETANSASDANDAYDAIKRTWSSLWH